MKSYAQPIKRLIAELAKLPGIGEKTAARLANYILRATPDDVEKLAESLVEVKRKIRLCRICLNPTEEDVCHICNNPSRDQHIICVVEEPDALAAIEESGVFQGTYHVLHGALAPLDGIGPENLRLGELQKRVREGRIEELILATNPNVHGEATALLITRMFKDAHIRVTRIAMGVPMGGDLKYVDKMTLSKSLEFRRGMQVLSMEKKTGQPLRRIDTKRIIATVKKLFIEANTDLGRDVVLALQDARVREESPIGKEVLNRILQNADIARENIMPICQDTGLAVMFVEIGQDVRVVGGDLREALEQGVREAYAEGYLRKSVCDPLTRANTQDNTPAVIHLDIVAGNQLKMIAMPKGGGSENMSQARMLTPSAGIDGIKKFVLETVEKAGANPCPPVIVGIGIGGSLEQACILAKKALLRPVGRKNANDERLAQMEEDLYEKINALGIGPAGLGGRITTLAVSAEMMPCHIASLPVAVNIQCHVARHREKTL